MSTTAQRSLAIVSCFVVIVTASVLVAGAQSLGPAVNSEPVTDTEIDQRTKLDLLTTHRQSARQDVIKALSNEKRMIKETEKWGIDPTNDEVDAAYAYLSSRMRITPEQLTKSLERQGIRVDTVKLRIRADMARKALIRLHYRYA
jgi:peptidyl-prolyl cis-trans isomerase SurA